MPGIGEHEVEVLERDAAAVIARAVILHALAVQPGAYLEIGDQNRSGRFQDVECVPGMVSVAVGEENMGAPL